jgi:CheY-like chemotaxis protein
MDFASKRLRLFGYSVTAFHDSREALAAFMSTPDRFQALVTDLTMPQITGVDLARKIRATGSMIPIVIMTGYGRNFVSSGGEAIPRCIVVNKPFVGEDLARALGQLFGSRAGPAK